MSNSHWTHYLLWPVSKKLYCRYWAARLAYKALKACEADGEECEVSPAVFAVYEFFRPNQTIKITVKKTDL